MSRKVVSVVEEGVLRAHIRHLLRESQGATTRTIETSPTSPSYRPFSFLPGVVIAAGVAGLAAIHNWVDGLCTPITTKTNFPIDLSRKYADKLVRELGPNGSGTISPATKNSYVESIESRGDGGVESTSDLVQHEKLLDELVDAKGAWGAGVEFGQLGTGPTGGKATMFTKLNTAYSRFSGCDGAFKDDETFPLTSRANYIKFLNDIAFVSHTGYVNGLTQQKADLFKVSGADSSIKQSLEEEAAAYKRFTDNMKR